MGTTCPKCGQACYISFTTVECSNEKCEYYSESLYPKKKPEDEDDDPNKDKVMYLWSNYHTDCGD